MVGNHWIEPHTKEIGPAIKYREIFEFILNVRMLKFDLFPLTIILIKAYETFLDPTFYSDNEKFIFKIFTTRLIFQPFLEYVNRWLLLEL